MAMREAVRRPKQAGKEFSNNAIGLLVAYAPIAAILALAGIPLGGVLIFGAVAVTVMSALLTGLTVWFGGGDPHPGSRPYDYYPGSEPVNRSGGGYVAADGWHDYSGPDSGGWDGVGGGADGGGGL